MLLKLALIKQLKNRYNDPSANRKFILGINRGKMKLYDVKTDEQGGLVNSNQTTTEAAGSGFDISFTDKFKSNSSDFSSWS